MVFRSRNGPQKKKLAAEESHSVSGVSLLLLVGVMATTCTPGGAECAIKRQ